MPILIFFISFLYFLGVEGEVVGKFRRTLHIGSTYDFPEYLIFMCNFVFIILFSFLAT